MLKTATAWMVALALAAIAWLWVAVRHDTSKSQDGSSPHAIATIKAQSDLRADKLGTTFPASQPPEASTTVQQLPNDQRAAAIKRAMTDALASARDDVAKGLVAQGLGSSDSEQIAQVFIERFASCVFDAARKDSEAQGMDIKEFLDGAEIVWARPAQAILNLGRVQASAVPCVTNVAQQAGIRLPDKVGVDVADRLAANVDTPPWAGEMEARIREHVASHPAITLTGLLVKCRSNGCNVLMGGRDIPIFDYDFDVFAEQNGFQHAVVGGDEFSRFVWLQR